VNKCSCGGKGGTVLGLFLALPSGDILMLICETCKQEKIRDCPGTCAWKLVPYLLDIPKSLMKLRLVPFMKSCDKILADYLR